MNFFINFFGNNYTGTLAYCIEWSCSPQLSSIFISFVSSYVEYSSVNQQLFEKLLCNQSNLYEKYGWFQKLSRDKCKINTFAFRIDEWDTRRSWKIHEECIALTAVCQKALLGLKWCRTAKKNQVCRWSHCRVMLAVSHSVSRPFH